MKRDEVRESSGLRRLLLTYGVAGVLLALVVGSAITIFVPVSAVPRIEFSVVRPFVGNPSYNVSYYPFNGTGETLLFNRSPFSLETPVTVSGGGLYSLSSLRLSSWYEHTQTEDGLLVELERTYLRYSVPIHVPYWDVSNVSYNVGITSLVADLEVSLSIGFDAGGPETKTVELKKDRFRVLTLQAPIATMRSDKPYGWASVGDVNLEFGFYRYAAVKIHWLTVVAQTVKPLSKLTVDMHDLEGNTLLDSLRFPFQGHRPIIELKSDKVDATASLIRPTYPNETVYLAPGNYSGVSGLYDSGETTAQYELDLHVPADSEVVLKCSLEMNKIEFDVSSGIPIEVMTLQLGGPDTEDIDNCGSLSNFVFFQKEVVYLPADSAIQVAFSYRPGLSDLSAARASVNPVGACVLRLHVVMQCFILGGIVMNTGLLLSACVVVGLLLGFSVAQLRGSTPSNRRVHARNPLVLPVLLLAASTVVPWFSASSVSPAYSNPTLHESGYFVPLAVTLTTSNHGPAIVTVDGAFLFQILVLMFLFWLPLKAAVLATLGHGKPTGDLTIIGHLLRPLLAAGVFHIFTLFTTTPSAGVLLALAAPASYILILVTLRIRKRYMRG